jgi:hypothetical protein
MAPLTAAAVRARVAAVSRAGFWAACVLVLFGTLADSDPTGGRFWDKGLHFTAFYVLATLGAVAYPAIRLRWVGLGLLLFGLAIEALQKLPFVHRDGSWGDFFADALGVGFALAPIALDRLRRELM